MGLTVSVELKNKEEVPKFIIYSDNDSLVIGKNGKNLQALSKVVSQAVTKEIGKSFSGN